MIVELHIHNKVHFEISHSCAGSCLNLDPEIYSFEHSCKRRFGLRCELLCPFGYINHTCLTAPIGIIAQLRTPKNLCLLSMSTS